MSWKILDVNQFSAGHFASLLETESRVWREQLRWDFTASAQLITTCLKEKRLWGYALTIDQQIKGYCFFFYDNEKGLIGDLFVEAGSASIHQIRRLLECAIAKLAGSNGVRRIEAQLPHFAFEELEPCFRSHCFDGYRRRFMALPLAKTVSRRHAAVSSPLQIAADGSPSSSDFLLEPWQRKHDRDAAQLLYCAYRNHVDTTINDQYGSLTGATRLIENIVHHGGCGEFLPGTSLVAIHRSTQKLAGILALTAVGPHNAHIPQVAIAGQFQGSGLGTAMLEWSFQQLAREGHREVSLTVTDLNAGAVRLYERLGFETFRPFGAFVWTRS